MTFKSRADAFSRAKKFHFCTSCFHMQKGTFKDCPACKAPPNMRVFFPSRIEMQRGAELIRMQVAGKITALKFHPRTDLIVEGVKICAYEADASYIENGTQVFEDTKPYGDFIEELSEVKIRLFDALHRKHGIDMRIHRRR